MREPRDVIAHGIYNYEESVCGGHPGTWQLYERAYPASARADREKADAILAALHDAGYEVVEREPLERVLDALVESAQRDLDAILRGEHHTP